jgi:hypothetical protein
LVAVDGPRHHTHGQGVFVDAAGGDLRFLANPLRVDLAAGPFPGPG